MKKYLLILLMSALSVGFTQAQTKSPKRGLAFNGLGVGDIQSLSPGLSWVYNWEQSTGNIDAMIQNGIDYVPMAWKDVDSVSLRKYVESYPSCKYILAYNEPNLTDQANMTPVQAAAIWPKLSKIAKDLDLKIVSPAVNYGTLPGYSDPTKWLDDFFALIDPDDISAIAVHCYLTSATQVASFINLFKKYNKPIWLTEFCYDMNLAPSAATQKKFLVETLDYLESEPYVARYAWFKERGSSSANISVLQRTTEGLLTELGEIFTYMSSHDENYYFTTDIQIPATQYVSDNIVNMEQTTDTSGRINLCGMGTRSWTEYNVDIPETSEYNVYFRNSNEYGPPDVSTLQISVNGIEAGNISFDNPGADIWNTQVCKATFQQGKQKIRLGFTRGGLRINWLEITKNELSSVTKVEADDGVKIYPNPVKDFLYLQISGNTKVTLYDVYGKCVYAGDNPESIDMTAYPAGMYILDMRNEAGGRKAEKIMKE
ncbi:MAG: glycosyl hydrolase [Candidatus Azobacteroides sp.]|nr:glycosyl hydrolase [Candidatus Azobacteroides sp.]